MIVQPVLVVAAALFSLGIYGILVRRNAVMVLLSIAAAEVGIGLAIVLMLFRNRQTANINEFDLMKW